MVAQRDLQKKLKERESSRNECIEKIKRTVEMSSVFRDICTRDQRKRFWLYMLHFIGCFILTPCYDWQKETERLIVKGEDNRLFDLFVNPIRKFSINPEEQKRMLSELLVWAAENAHTLYDGDLQYLTQGDRQKFLN